MPFAPAFERALRARAHGWEPKKESLRKISPAKAEDMLDEASRKREGQKRALRRMSY